MDSRQQGISATLIAAASFALSPVLYKVAYGMGLSPAQVLALHTWIAAIVLLIIMLVFNRESFRVKSGMLGVLAVAGLVGKLGTNILVAFSLLFLPAGLAVLLLYLYTVFTVVSRAVFFRKRIEGKEIASLILVTSGAAIASGVYAGVKGTSITGICLALGAAVSYTVYNLVGEVALAQVAPLAVMSYTQWVSSLGLIVYLGKKTFIMPWNSSGLWGIGLAMAAASSVPYYLILYGIQRIGSGKASILSTFELPMTYVISAVVIREIPRWNQIIGGLLVVFGIVLLNLWQDKANRIGVSKKRERSFN